MATISNAVLSKEIPLMFNTFGISGHANVTNIGGDNIIYEITDNGIASSTHEKVASIDERLRIVHDNKSMEETLRWVAAPDPSANYVAARGKHQPGTGIWFEQRADFKEWKDSPGDILCIYGDPGTGKTILCSSIIEDVQTLCEKSPLSGYAYFFFDSRSAERGLLLYNNLIRSILTQLSYRCNGIPAALQDLYLKHGSGREQPSLKSLHETLQRVMEGFDHVYIVIDSLDECGNRSELLNWITTLDIWRCPNLHLLLTSRPEPDIRRYLEGLINLRRVTIEAASSQRDIEVYLDARLAKITQWSKATREAVRKRLMESADGMFRWVALQLDDLERCFNPREIKAQLDALPKDLAETYERIIARNPRRRDLLQLLHWLAFSARALVLQEFAEIVSVDIEADGRPSYDAELRYEDPATALTVCTGLITETEGQVKLAHFSVKEFLMSEQIKTGPAAYSSISEQISHATIAQTCLAYLLVLDKYESLTESTFASFPLALYAAEHWPTHFRAARDSNYNFHDLLLSLFNVDLTLSYAMANWVRLDDSDRAEWYNHPYTRLNRAVKDIHDPIYYASLLNLTQVVDSLLNKGAHADTLGNRGTALQAASFYGGLDVARLLLDSGADVNAATGGMHDDYGTALQAASRNGHLDVAELLLESGANANAQVWHCGTALQAASFYGYLDIAKLLLESGADVDAQGGCYGTALQAASDNGHLDVTKLLLESGANVNARGGLCDTALQAASRSGHLDVAELLLESGAEVDAQGGFYGTALQAASENGHLDVIKLLLESGADVNAQGGFYGTALQAASENGYLNVIKLLLDSGADELLVHHVVETQ